MIKETAEKDIVSLLHALLQGLQVYDANNDVVAKAAQKFLDHINSLFQTISHITIVRSRDYLFINKRRLRFEIFGYASLQAIYHRLKALNIRSITLLPGINRDELIGYTLLLRGGEGSIGERWSSQKFPHIQLELQEKDEVAEDSPGGDSFEIQRQKEHIKQTYFKSLAVVKNFMDGLWTNKSINIGSYKRIVYGLANFISQDERSLLALTSIKDFDAYTYIHSLNVGILAMILGQRIGFNRKTIVKLGMSGILHDIGKIKVPKELIDKSEKLTEKEWEVVRLHADYGVIEILKTKGLDEMGLASMIVAFQHHWNYDNTGYPDHEERHRHTFFARIVRICDAYDAMITTRPYQPVPFLPHFALRVIWAHKNTFFDPILVKVLIQLLGIYPVGSCLELNSREIGLVIRQNPGYLDLPIVKIVTDTRQKRNDGKTIDLSQERSLEIIKPVYPQQYGINIAEYLM